MYAGNQGVNGSRGNVRPEDIEDVTERYQQFVGMESEADTVKRIRLENEEEGEKPSLFLVSLVEHKSLVDYNVSIQLLRYMDCIWTEYGKEMEQKNKGCTRTKEFRYPPILPIVYYEGTQSWSAGMHLRDRIWMSEVFGTYLPDFTYRVIRIHDFSDEELLARENEMALLMMINKIQGPEDISRFLNAEREQIDRILQKSEEPVLNIIADTFWGLLMKMNVPQEEALRYVEKVKERRMGYLFENMEKMDIQAERRNTAEARAELAEAKEKLAEVEEKLVEAEAKLVETTAEAEVQLVKAAAEKQFLYKMSVHLCQRQGMTREDTVKMLSQECELAAEEANGYVDRYWE